MIRTAPLSEQISRADLAGHLDNEDPNRVLAALNRHPKTPQDLALLLSPGADEVLEEIARVAKQVTLERFGRTVQLYIPLYLSNYCVGKCPYCGFRNDRKIARHTLSLEELGREIQVIKDFGMRDLLLVAGESQKEVSIQFLCSAVALAKKSFPSVLVEVAPLSKEDYQSLIKAGASGVTLYQETYDMAAYQQLHQKGPKADYQHRLESLDRAGDAGMRKLNTGALLGLAPWRLEGLRLGMHAAYLQTKWWQSQVSIGLPRLHNVPDDFSIPSPIDDRAFVHLIVALRVFLPDAGLVISTREPPELRARLIHLGITHMSAGSRTEPGGYSMPGRSGDQFEVSDHRTPKEVADTLEQLGYDPVWKDWDDSFCVGETID